MANNNSPEFDPASLSAMISYEIETAMLFDDNELKSTRARNIEYLRGEMKDMPPRPNGSKYTSRDLNDTMSWVLPSIMRLFTGSAQLGIYEPTEPGDEEVCEQATDMANHVFWKDNDGYQTIYDAAYDALGVAGDGIIKAFWDDTPITTVTHHTGLTIDQIQVLETTDGVEVVAQKKGQSQLVVVPDETGAPIEVEIETFDVKIERVRLHGKICIEAIAPENFIINEEAINIPDYRFCAHYDPYKTRSDLVEMGFDAEEVSLIGVTSAVGETEEAYARNENFNTSNNSMQKSTQRVGLYECYMKIDTDGDGIAETIKVFYSGQGSKGTVLDWEVSEDEAPFHKIPCYPRAHEYTSESLADRTTDIQQLRTVAQRAINDNLAASSLPQIEIEENSVLNMDSIINPRFGGIIHKKKNTPPINRFEIPFVADKMMLQHSILDGIIEKRTGVSKTMMALDPSALQNQTATANQNARDASYSQIELIGRNMANGLASVFESILRLLVRHQDRPRTIRLRDDYVEVDPRSWNANMDCTVNIGLGTGSRDRDMSMLMVILKEQKEQALMLHQAGAKEQAIDMLPMIANTQKKITEAAGIKNPETYWPEFKEEDIIKLQEAAKQPPSDPKMEFERQKHADDMELKKMESESSVLREQAQMEADLQVEANKLNSLLIVDQQKIASNERLEKQRIDAKAVSDNKDFIIAQERLEIERTKVGVSAQKVAADVGKQTKDGEL